jgi:hypothetical protein
MAYTYEILAETVGDRSASVLEKKFVAERKVQGAVLLNKNKGGQAPKVAFYTFDLVFERASQYKSRVEFCKKDYDYSRAAYRKGWHSEIADKLGWTKWVWNYNTCLAEASKHQTYAQWFTSAPSSIDWLRRNGKLSGLRETLFGPKDVEVKSNRIAKLMERYLPLARQCTSRSDFGLKFNCAYMISHRNGFFEEIALLMGWPRRKNKPREPQLQAAA